MSTPARSLKAARRRKKSTENLLPTRPLRKQCWGPKPGATHQARGPAASAVARLPHESALALPPQPDCPAQRSPQLGSHSTLGPRCRTRPKHGACPLGPGSQGIETRGTPYDGTPLITAISRIHVIPASYFVSRLKMEKNKYESPTTFLKNVHREK